MARRHFSISVATLVAIFVIGAGQARAQNRGQAPAEEARPAQNCAPSRSSAQGVSTRGDG